MASLCPFSSPGLKLTAFQAIVTNNGGFLRAMTQSEKPVLALAMGDPAGVGPELTAKARADPEIRAAAEEEHDFWGLGTGEDHQKISKVHFGIAVFVRLQPIASGS